MACGEVTQCEYGKLWTRAQPEIATQRPTYTSIETPKTLAFIPRASSFVAMPDKTSSADTGDAQPPHLEITPREVQADCLS
jgi:hypothetical protein